MNFRPLRSILVFLGGPILFADPDWEAPRLLGLRLESKTVVLSNQPVVLRGSMRVSDDVSGVVSAAVLFRWSGRTDSRFDAAYSASWVPADLHPVLEQEIRFELLIATNSPAGFYEANVNLRDAALRSGVFTSMPTSPGDFDGGFEVNRAEPFVPQSPPFLRAVSLEFDSPSVDVRDAAASVGVVLRARPTVEGQVPGDVILSFLSAVDSTSGQASLLLDTPLPIGGDGTVTYRGALRVPKRTRSTRWYAILRPGFQIPGLRDGPITWNPNEDLRPLGAELEIVGSSDVEAPRLTGFRFSHDSVEVVESGPEIVLSVEAEDPGSGFGDPTPNGFFLFPSGSVEFAGPDLQQRVSASLVWAGSPDLDSPLVRRGRWEARLQLPRYAQDGLWHVTRLRIQDQAGNPLLLTGASLTALGFTNAVRVIHPPRLVEERSDGESWLRWRQGNEPYRLQHRARLDGDSWTDGGHVIEAGNHRIRFLGPEATTGFYRLIRNEAAGAAGGP